jgi:hypothetical protein
MLGDPPLRWAHATCSSLLASADIVTYTHRLSHRSTDRDTGRER